MSNDVIFRKYYGLHNRRFCCSKIKFVHEPRYFCLLSSIGGSPPGAVKKGHHRVGQQAAHSPPGVGAEIELAQFAINKRTARNENSRRLMQFCFVSCVVFCMRCNNAPNIFKQ